METSPVLNSPQHTRREHVRILIIDDEESLVKILSKLLIQSRQDEVFSASTVAEGLEKNALLHPDLILLDLQLPDGNGIEILSQINQRGDTTSVIIITGTGTIESAVEAMRMGAEDYLEKPVNSCKLKIAVQKIVEKRGLLQEIDGLKRRQKEMYQKVYLFSSDPQMKRIYGEIEQIAQQEKVTVMILGETGTGKEHVAGLIHALSSRASKPFVELHCGSLPESILESELFGYEPGAFTDAKRQKLGLFEEAQGGTVFLDEIGELTPSVQMKLLKVLDQKTLRRLGGNKEITLDIRIITATHRDLQKDVAEGHFRTDLYYRLNVIPLHIPALRERPHDIVELANFFFQESSKAYNKKLSLLSDDILNLFQKYAWPGNIRELKNVIERMVVTAKNNSLSIKDIPKEILEAEERPGHEKGVLTKDQAEMENIHQAMMKTHNNKTKAAELLGVNRKTLMSKLKNHHLE